MTPKAAYQQVACVIARRIAAGEPGYHPGDTLPPAGVAARQLGLGVDTVRDAHHLLANLGMLSLSRGYGPVVRAPRDREVVHVPVGTAITARMPTLEEMTQWSLEPGVPMLVAGDKAWPADRYEFVAGPTHQPPNPDT